MTTEDSERSSWRLFFAIISIATIVALLLLLGARNEGESEIEKAQVSAQFEGLWWNERYDTNAIAEIRERLDKLEHKQASTHQAGPNDVSIDLWKEKEWRGRLEWKFVDPSTGTTDTVAPRLEPRP